MSVIDAPVVQLKVPDLSEEALAAVTAEIPVAGLAAAHRAGLLTATVAPEYGGPGLGPRDVARILTALGEGDASVALLAANTLMSHAGQAAARRTWPSAYYEDLLRKSAAGPALVNAI